MTRFALALAYITALASMCSSGYVIAQTFSRFGSARFGQNIFGAIAGPPASIPTMPVSMIALSAALVAIAAYLIRFLNHKGAQS